MAVGDRVESFFGRTTLGTGNTTLLAWVYPNPYRYVITQITIVNSAPTTRWFSLALGGTSLTATNCFFYRMLIAAYDTLVLDTMMSISSFGSASPSDSLQGSAEIASSLIVSLYGWTQEY